MESGNLSRHAITSWRGRDKLDLALVHSPLPEFSTSVCPEMMQPAVFVENICPQECRIVAVAGWDVWDGAAESSLQLARGMAALGQPVFLVDGDFASPILHRQLKSSASPGLAELIAGRRTILEVVRPTSDELLFFLPAGNASALGTEGLSPRACSEVF